MIAQSVLILLLGDQLFKLMSFLLEVANELGVLDVRQLRRSLAEIGH